MPKRYRLFIVPEDGGSIRTVRMPSRILPAAMTASVSALLLLTAASFFIAGALDDKKEAARLREENAGLRHHVEAVEVRLDAAMLSLEATQKLEREARLLAGLESEEAGAGRVGVGGPSSTFAPHGAETLRAQIDRQIDIVEELEQRVAVQRQFYTETLTSLEASRERLNRIPMAIPVADGNDISSEFGWREDPFTGEIAFHQGIDFRGPIGMPVLATAPGVVVSVGDRGEYGLAVLISHGDGIETMYAHLDSASCEEGDRVGRGDVVGALGSSGRSTGPHVHYEVRIDGVAQNPRQFRGSRQF